MADPEDKTPGLELYARRKARRTLLDFTQYTKPDYTTNWHHAALAQRLDRVAARKCRRLMVFMPPQHGKSELVSRRFPAYMLGKKPEMRLIQASHTYDLACSMNRDVQRIMTDDPYRRLFPESTLAERFQRDKIAARRTMDLFELPGHRGSLRSAGVANSIAGNPADGAIIDDPFGKREDADSPTMRQKVWDWYTNDLFTRLSAEAWIVLTHTRWHRDDLAGRLLRKMADRAADQWEILSLPAVKEEGPGDECDARRPGEALWPAFKSPHDLAIIRQQDAKTYAALYQQNPSDASNAEWPPELFDENIWVQPEHWPKHFELKVLCLDPSKGKTDKQGDYCAIVFAGISRGLVYVDAKIERIPMDHIVRATLAMATRFNPHMIGIEGVAFQEMLVHEFRRQCGGTFGLTWPTYVMQTAGTPKIQRIRRLSQYVINRELRFKADSPGCRLLVEQLIDFPLGEHDDGPDCLEMCTRLPFEAMK